MTKSALLTATALSAVLLDLALISPAAAGTTLSSDSTTGLVTSSAGDTTVSSSGSITMTSGTAITVDSDNSLDLEGTIQMSGSESGSTGVLISDVPNRTAALTLGGTIYVTDDYTASDTTDDDITDAPWAEGTGRYGIHSVGTHPFTGDVAITSALDVEGNDSYGVRFENKIDGNFTFDGSSTIIGDNSVGIALDSGATGNVYLSGSAAIAGAGASAVRLNGDILGSLTIDGSYSGTGYSLTSLPDSDTLAGLDPSLNLLQSGTLVSISSNVANGVLLGSAVTSTDDSNDDEDGDGLSDSTQSTAYLTQYGSAPALSIGSSSSDISLGGLTYASTAIDPPAVNYGLLVRGSVASYGIYPGVTATALRIGGQGYGVDIANGIGVSGSISGYAYAADATAISLLSGTTTPRLDVTGTVTASTATATTATTTDDVTTYTTAGGGSTARAIDIADGASLGTITVGESSGLYATATGSTANATVIRDQSNSLSQIDNSGSITASITASDDDGDGTSDTITGQAIAIDTRGNTTGLTLTQTDTAPDDDDIATPSIVGDILLGSGDDVITSSGGVIYGAVDYGTGAGALTLGDGAAYAGKLTSAGAIAMDIDGESTAVLAAGSSVELSTLHVGSGSTLGLTLDTDSPSQAILRASGTVQLDDDAELDLALDKIITDPTTFTVLTASGIDLGNVVTSTRDGYVPYLYHADLSTDEAETTLYANFRLKTQAEAGYSDNQYTALMPVLAAVEQDSGATSAILSETTKSGFDSVYNQYLPDYSGETLLTLAQGAQSVNRALGALTLVPDNGAGQYWLQEYNLSTSRAAGETAGFTASGFSLAGGRERAVFGNQTLGMYMSMSSSSPHDSYAMYEEVSSATDYMLGAYWRLNSGGTKAWAHAGGGYAEFATTRNILTSTVTHTAKASWDGYAVMAGAGISHSFAAGAFAVTPEALIDYYGLTEKAHNEYGGGDYFDLSVARRSGDLLASTFLVRTAYTKGFVHPEAWLGYKDNIQATIGDTTANFVNGDPFTLTGGNVKGGGPLAGVRLSVDNPYSYVGVEAEVQALPKYTNASVSLRARFQF